LLGFRSLVRMGGFGQGSLRFGRLNNDTTGGVEMEGEVFGRGQRGGS
jgi:hypothetical protein